MEQHERKRFVLQYIFIHSLKKQRTSQQEINRKFHHFRYFKGLSSANKTAIPLLPPVLSSPPLSVSHVRLWHHHGRQAGGKLVSQWCCWRVIYRFCLCLECVLIWGKTNKPEIYKQQSVAAPWLSRPAALVLQSDSWTDWADWTCAMSILKQCLRSHTFYMWEFTKSRWFQVIQIRHQEVVKPAACSL